MASPLLQVAESRPDFFWVPGFLIDFLPYGTFFAAPKLRTGLSAEARLLFLRTNSRLRASHTDLTVFAVQKKLDFLRTHAYLMEYVGRE